MVQLATKTLEAINLAVAKDLGNEYRRNLGLVLPYITDAYRDDEDDYRSHLGGSRIGGECEREVWYEWRWALKRPPKGRKGEDKKAAHSRMIRLWNRGHLEEGRFIALMMTIGVQIYSVDPQSGKQFRISDFGGHFGGALDSILVGIPDLPAGVACLGEYKTHSDKSFGELKINGVMMSKPEHYAQMTIYMRHMGLQFALYMAVNKNDDELHAEIVEYNARASDQLMERARRVIFSDEPPPRMRNASPGFFICKLCDMADVCYRTVHVDRNCRTCGHSKPLPDGTWVCTLNGDVRDKEAQIEGCADYSTHHDLRK